MLDRQKIRINHLFDSYSNFYQPYIPPVIESLLKIDNLKIEVNAFNGESNKNVKVFPAHYKRKFKEKIFAVSHTKLPKLNYAEIFFLQNKIDIVHIQHSYLFPKVLGLLSMLTNKRPKIIITLRGGDTYVKPWHYKKWSDFFENFGNKVDAFITMSEHQKEYLHNKWGVSKERIYVVPISYGYKVEVQPKQPNKDVMKIISAFRMCWEKNIDGNLRTIKSLKNMGIPVQYDVYGDGSDVGQLFYLIDKYNLSDCVCYHRKIKNEVLKNLLPQYDFFLQLSHSESLGISVVEAQAYGVPAIVSNSDGLPESIIDGKTGFSVDTYNIEDAAKNMLYLWENIEMYNSFSREAIKYVNSKFTISAEVNKLKEVYSILAKQ